MSEEQITPTEIREQEGGYKKTRVGSKSVVIPAEWNVEVLSEIASVSGGKRLPKAHSYSNEETSYPYIRVVDFENGSVSTDELNYINEETHEQIQRYTISDDDVYISIAGTLGIAGTIPDCLSGGNLTENAAKIHDLSGVHRDYLSYYIRSKFGQDEVHRFTVGSTQPKLSIFRLRKLETILPPLSEQRKIATVLHTVDQAIQKTEEIIKQSKRINKAIVKELTMKGINHTNFKKFDVTPTYLDIEFPELWQKVTYKDITKNITYGFTNPMPEADSGRWMITAKDIKDGRINYQTARKTTERAFSEDLTNKSRPEPGSVLVTKDGTLGRVAVVDRDGICINQSVASLSPIKERITPRFLALSIKSPLTQELIQAHNPQTTIGHIKISELAEWELGLPPIEEQKEIISVVNSVRNKYFAEKEYKNQLELFKHGLMQDLLSGEVRTTDVNIDIPEEVAKYA